MKNLVVLEDNAWEFPSELSPALQSSHIVSTAVNVINGEIILLTNTGILISHGISSEECAQFHHEPWDLNLITENASDTSWFAVKIVSETGAIVCLSHSGHIVSVASNRLTDEWADAPEAEGCVEAGIAAAAWNPDESVLVLATHNDTLLCMTSSFELVSESPTLPRPPDSPCLISWRGDGMQFSMYSIDASDSIAKVRLFNKDLELLFEGRNVGDGAQAIVRNLLPAMAYATNGSLIAVAQQRTPKKQQIVFLERSGLRHGEFDLQDPAPLADVPGSGTCCVVHLEWNLESTLLAVVLEHEGSGQETDDDVHGTAPYRTVQLYYRNNYYWYLKQQWSGQGLWCLGFDVEVPDRLYLSEKRTFLPEQPIGSSGVCLRILNMVWDTCVSLTPECSCVVMDGKQLKVTPLGKAVVPPPMCKYTLPLPAACQHVSFGSAAGGVGWVLAALCDQYRIRMFYHTKVTSEVDEKRLTVMPQQSEDIDLRALGGEAIEKYQIRGIQAVECQHEKQSFLVVVCVASAAKQEGTEECGRDNILVLWRSLTEAEGSAGWVLDSYPIQDGGKAQRLVPWATDINSVGVGIMTQGAVSAFNVTKIVFFYNATQEHIDVNFTTEFVFSENCSRQFAVIKLDQTLSLADASSKEKEVGVENDDKFIFVGLSAAPHTSRLYVNDSLLSSSHVSSFASNPALGVLMFITASAKPLLQFTSIESLHNIVTGEMEANLLLYENNINDAPTNVNATTSFAKRNNTDSQHAIDTTANAVNKSSVVTFALPRPVERGTRLVGTPSGSALVVLQMPRGNLEGCEPRPLVLMKSRLLLADCKYFECLLLLRRQRIDMNLLVDHNPSKFVANVNDFVSATLEQNPEFLSLLISALEVGNVCFEKYPIPSLYTNFTDTVPATIVSSAVSQQGGIEAANNSFQWEDKVNVICEHLRSALFEYISCRYAAEEKSDFGDALLPLLCTYAKQQPPLLSEALYLVKRFALGLTVSPTLSATDLTLADTLTENQVSNALSHPKSQKCLKYIAFLCDYNELFRAALGECDFDMARTIARQGGQMDPKEYLPLLSRLHTYNTLEHTVPDSNTRKSRHVLSVQDSSVTCEHANSAAYCLMRFNVYVHLAQYQEALKWALQCVRVISMPVVASSAIAPASPASHVLEAADEKSLLQNIISIVSAHNLHTLCIPALRALRVSITAASASFSSSGSGGKRPVLSLTDIAARKSNKDQGLRKVTSLLSKVLFSYGEYCHTQGLYDEAIAAFLSCTEPSAPRCAVHAAIVNGNWHEAIAIGGRYYVEGDDDDDDENDMDPYGSNKVTSLNPKRVAQGIIEDYKSMLEQGLGGIESNEYISIFCSNAKTPQVVDIAPRELSGETQAISIATLCVEYFNDVEGAVAILLLAKAWRAAAHVASRHRRSDLLTEEVGGALRFEAKAMIRLLPERTKKQTDLVMRLNEMWSDPTARLEAVSGVDAGGLLAALRGEDEATEETRSEFGGGMSVYSNLSLASNMSHSSNTSSASNTLSMLSDSMLSQASGMPQSAGAGYYSSRKPSSSSFSVVGLEHNLLSRGKGDISDAEDSNDGEFHPHETNKQKRLRKKKEMKGRKQTRERDVFGLKLEAAMSKELYELGDISSVATTVSTVCSVLLLIGGTENQLLACQLQACMDSYTTTIAAHTAPSAPLYPLSWLRRRDMEEVRWFQATPENANALLTHVAEGVWWRQAVRGLALWKKIRKNTLASDMS